MLALFSGCTNKDLGQVSGTVTLDDEPLADALVLFTPMTGGRPTGGRTDSSGRYTLVYDRSDSGAILGEHFVEITTADEIANDDDTVTVIEEKLPIRYNRESELRADVKEGSQTFDWELTSEGEIMSAEEAGEEGTDEDDE
jgi:hypothetical protein